MNNKLDLFIRWFENKFPLSNKTPSVRIYENFEDTYEEVADILTEASIKKYLSEEKKKCGGVVIGFGYAMGSIASHNKNLTLTHQRRYKDTPVWAINVAAPLNINPESIFYSNGFDENDDIEEEDFRATSVGEYLKWLINPNGNVEIAADVFKGITVPMLREVSDRMPGKSKKSITVAIPPFSPQLEAPNWEELFEDLQIGNTKVEIVPTSSLYLPEQNERLYIVWKHSWFFDDCYVVEAIERSNDGTPMQIAAYAFLERVPDKYYPLREIDYATVNLDAMKAIGGFIDAPKQETVTLDFQIVPKLPINEGLLAFLGSHSPSFCWEFYSIKENAKAETEMEAKVAALMQSQQSLQVAVLCGNLCGESNMLNISLSDMVSVGIALENKKVFSPTTMANKIGENFLGTNTNILPKQNIHFEQLPANYYSFAWKYLKKDFDRNSYAKASLAEIRAKYKKDNNLDAILGMLVAYFSPARTDELAEELLYIFDVDATPTARFVAGLFWYLAHNSSFAVEKKSEEIQGFEVLETKTEPNLVVKATTKKSSKSVYSIWGTKQKNYAAMGIEELDLSVRSYNCLKRAGINTVKELSEMTEIKLTRVRNLGNNCVIEIKEKLAKLGLTLQT